MTWYRAALTELLAAIGADASRPQDVARRFRINRNLAWKLSKIVHATDPLRVVQHLPGASWLRILLATCADHGASREVCDRVTEARAAFDRVVARHAGDRTTLDVMLRAMASGEAAVDEQEPSRRQAFEGQSAIWGVQARLQFGVLIHVPSDEPGLVDAIGVGGLLGFQRLRPTASWPLVRHLAHRQEEDGTPSPVGTEPLDPSADPNGPPLVRAFSTVDASRLSAVEDGPAHLWELGDGPVGLTGRVDCVFARRNRRIGSDRAGGGFDAAVAAVPLGTPVESMMVDLLVHRDLAYGGETPEMQLIGRLKTSRDVVLGPRDPHRLPVAGRLVDLGRGPPSLASPWSPRHAELVGWAVERLCQPLDAFQGWRMQMTFPPIPSTPLLRVTLPD